MATKRAKRVRANMERAKVVRHENGDVPASQRAALPDFPGDGSGRPASLDLLKRRMPDLTASDVIEFMGLEIIDVFEDNLPIEKAKVANSAVGRMLKAAEMQERYGQQVNHGSPKRFSLGTKKTLASP